MKKEKGSSWETLSVGTYTYGKDGKMRVVCCDDNEGNRLADFGYSKKKDCLGNSALGYLYREK